jgi:hypothetical protein
MSIHGLPPTPPPPGSNFGSPQDGTSEPWQVLANLLSGWATTPPAGTSIANDIAGAIPLLSVFINDLAQESAWKQKNPAGFQALQTALATLEGVKSPTGSDLTAFVTVLNSNMPTLSTDTDLEAYSGSVKFAFTYLEQDLGSIEAAGGTLSTIEKDQMIAMGQVLHAFVNGQDEEGNFLLPTPAISQLNDLVDPNPKSAPDPAGHYGLLATMLDDDISKGNPPQVPLEDIQNCLKELYNGLGDMP